MEIIIIFCTYLFLIIFFLEHKLKWQFLTNKSFSHFALMIFPLSDLNYFRKVTWHLRNVEARTALFLLMREIKTEPKNKQVEIAR